MYFKRIFKCKITFINFHFQAAFQIDFSQWRCVYYVPQTKLLTDCVHTAYQLADGHGCDTGMDVRHGIGNNELVVVNGRTAGVYNVGNITLAPVRFGVSSGSSSRAIILVGFSISSNIAPMQY